MQFQGLARDSPVFRIRVFDVGLTFDKAENESNALFVLVETVHGWNVRVRHALVNLDLSANIEGFKVQ